MSDEDLIKNLGPLAPLVGVWEGSKGVDVAPSPSRGSEQTPFRERIVFEAMDMIDNHEQELYGLRYSTIAYRIGDEDPFHEELGYWLWDAGEGQVMRCFLVPRGITILAGGDAEADDQSFQVAADVDSETYGISSNLFLDREFKTVRYELTVTIQDADTFRYEEDTQILLKDLSDVFHHRDSNILTRVA
jgi:hypothetical protein